MPRIRSIANVVKLSGCEVPDWMLAIKPVSCVLLILWLLWLFGCVDVVIMFPSSEIMCVTDLSIFIMFQLNTKEKKQLRKSAPVRRHIDTSTESRAHKPKMGGKEGDSGGKSSGNKFGKNKKRRV